MSRKSVLPFTKAFRLRHKSTVDWGMRDTLPNKRHWDKYWHQLEARRKSKDSENELEEDKEILATKTSTNQAPNYTITSQDKNIVDKLGDSVDGLSDPEIDYGESLFWEETVETIDDSESGYFYHSQILDHFYDPPSTSDYSYTPTPPPLNSSFRQYYHISNEFYKPGGPIILWIPGESPLHTLFLRRGLAYELANATSGLLVALEHRFYGNSIPRLQDSHPSQAFSQSSFNTKQDKANPFDSNKDNITQENIPLVQSKTNSTAKTSKPETNGNIKSKGGSKRKSGDGGSNKSNGTPNIKSTTKHNKDQNSGNKAEGLPLDLLAYLNVDQSIEDIAYFIDRFPELQPKYFGNSAENSPNTPLVTRWILAGCSYGGNLAAWTRQRYPSKIFAAFASSAPVHSVLDFYEYSTSQSNIIGKQCSQRMTQARDFLDDALLMTDNFMKQMTLFDKNLNVEVKTERSLGRDPVLVTKKAEAGAEENQHDSPSADQPSLDTEKKIESPSYPTLVSTVLKNNTIDDKQARQEAKLRVLTWFSSDFAQDYSTDGEEVHAAGWIWWTVASAVQYNSIVTPPTVQPPKSAVDILCETMAQADKSGITNNAGDNELQDAEDSNLTTDLNSRSNTTSYKSLQNLEYAKALASWFKYQQYFTPTRTEDLQPSDVDPNSVQNLAGVAWLWQTCSELGYLQTSQPSSCCCSSDSLPPPSENKSEQPADSIATPSTDSFTINSTIGRMIKDDINPKPKPNLSQPFPLRERITRSRFSKKPKSSCLPCPCYARHGSQAKESMFSRLLTLEAAWQECEYYFGEAGSIQQQIQNNATKKDRLKSQGQKQEKQGNATTQSSQVGRSNTNNTINGTDDISYLNPTNGTRPLLNGYPDVEKNVNTKFRSWGIVEDADTIAWSEGGKSFEFSTDSKVQRPKDQPKARVTATKSTPAIDIPPECNSAVVTLIPRKKAITTITTIATMADATIVVIVTEITSTVITPTFQTVCGSHDAGQDSSTSIRSVASTAIYATTGSCDQQSTQYIDEDDADTNTNNDAVSEVEVEDENERNVVRIIPGASHCQDILYESSDLESAELREERQNVLKTFVRWIEIDVKRQQIIQKQYQQSKKH
ncbi:hypothetical protein BGZ76_005171 [Entomortierella beljakovae]|nr:hypothetical protein BGZ76_005171 [Entomortierella beljakovae]